MRVDLIDLCSMYDCRDSTDEPDCRKLVSHVTWIISCGSEGASPAPPLLWTKIFLILLSFYENLANLYVAAPPSWRVGGESWIRP